jgi:hypothetical protein
MDDEITEDELRERLAGEHGDGRSEHSLEHELPIGPADDGGGLDQGPPGTTSRGTAGGATGEVTGSTAPEQGTLDEEATPEDAARVREHE